MTGAAVAADLPSTKEAPAYVPPAFSWTGFYIGFDVGAFGARQSATATGYPSGFGAPAISGAGFPGIGILPTSHNLNSTGVLGGGHVGYSWQISQFVIGAEGDVTAIQRSRSDTETTFDTFDGASPDGSLAVSTRGSYLASIRGRLGYAFDRVLFYATGGVAWTNTSSTAVWAPIPGALFPTPSASSVGYDATRTGFVVGGGVEWLLAPHWILRAEFLHYGFDGTDGVLPFVVEEGDGCTPRGTCGWNVANSTLQFNTELVGLSYKF